MRIHPLYISLVALGLSWQASAQPRITQSPGAPAGTEDEEMAADTWRAISPENAVYYALQTTVIFTKSDSTRPFAELLPREPVEMVRSSRDWAEIVKPNGTHGFVSRSALSNLWIRISKSSRTVWLHRGADVDLSLPADMAYNFFLDKERRGSSVEADHWRTPEGLYYVVARNEESRFYKALVLNYPSAVDAKKGLEEGLISESQYYAILEADQRKVTPPMDTPLGGWIEIHGEGSGWRTTWTRGCVAVTNSSMDDLWAIVPVGTPVLIES
jgi:hypothetical protein